MLIEFVTCNNMLVILPLASLLRIAIHHVSSLYPSNTGQPSKYLRYLGKPAI